MIWHELKQLLAEYPAEVICEHNTSAQLLSVMYLAPIFSKYSSEVLYIGYYKDFCQKDIPENSNISVLLCCDQQPDREFLSTTTQNAMCIFDEEAFLACADFLQIFYSHYQSMDEWLKLLYEKMHKGASLSDVTNMIAERYQKPVNIVDSSYTVIAVSSNFEDYDYRLAGDQHRGYVPPNIIKSMNIRAKRKNKLAHEPILLEDPENGTLIHYNTPILVDDIQIGAFSIYMHPGEQLPYEQYLFLPNIARILSIYLQKKHFFLKSNDNYCSGLLESLFMNSDFSVIDIESRLAAFGHEVLETKYILTVNIANLTSATVAQIASSIQNILKHSIYTTLDSELVFLCSYNEPDIASNDQMVLDIIANIPSTIPSLRVGISSRFTALSDAKNALIQAQSAMEIGSVYEPTKKVFIYDDYRLECMVYRLSETTNISLYCYPQLYALLEYDKQHQTQLLYTLFVYICCAENKSLSFMCKKLNIHKNTLYFRLNKAKELTGLNYEKPSVSAMMMFTFALMRLNNQITWSQLDL